jgi:hypothetical protein
VGVKFDMLELEIESAHLLAETKGKIKPTHKLPLNMIDSGHNKSDNINKMKTLII